MFGRKISYPSSVVVDPPIHPYYDADNKQIDIYVKALRDSFKDIHPRALANIKKADERNKKLYDDRHHR